MSFSFTSGACSSEPAATTKGYMLPVHCPTLHACLAGVYLCKTQYLLRTWSCMLTCIVKLQEGEESYPLYKKEKDGLIDSLKRRAEMIEGVGLQPVLSCMHVYIGKALHM